MFHEDQQIGHYTLIKQLGIGGFGEVWLARNQNDPASPHVAIKLPKSEDVDWQAIVQEIGLWVLCGKHPNVLPFIEARNYNGQIAIISEYAPDGSLRDLLEKQGALSIKQVVEMVIGVLDGLVHLHSSRIIHRDLKPENILLRGNAPRLADFGISRVITANEYSNTISGTASYMAPESFNGKRTVQTDVWAVGVILYELLEGRLPFPQRMRQELHEAISTRQPEPFSQAIPSKLQEVTLKALAKQPEARYQTSTEVRQALHDYWLALYEQETISTIKQTIPFVELETTIEIVRLIPYRKSDSWGFCDSNKNIVIIPKYDFVYSFSEGLACVKLNDKYGFIDKRGQEVIPIKCDWKPNSFGEGNSPDEGKFSEGLVRVELNDKYGYIDKAGREVIPIKYDFSSRSKEGLVWVFNDHEHSYFDNTGREIIQIRYEWVGEFSEGLAEVWLNGKRGFINNKGEEVIQLKYDSVGSFNEGLAQVELNGRCGYIDKVGREVIPINHLWEVDSDGGFSEGVAAVKLDGKWGYIDKTGREIISIKYDAAHRFSEGLAGVELNDKWGYIDRTGREIIPPSYDYAQSFSEGWACVETNDNHGYIDQTGREIIPIKYDWNWGAFSEGLVCIGLNGKWGFFDKSRREVIPLKYDFAYPFSEGLAGVRLNGRYGFIDKAGREIVPLKYDYVWSFSEGVAQVELGGKLFSGRAELLGIRPVKDSVDAKLNSKRGYIGHGGTEYFED